jgi:hypothetical protein
MHATPVPEHARGSEGPGKIVRGALGWMLFLALCVALLRFTAQVETTRRLRHAILHGDAQTVRTLLTEGADPSERLIWRETPLALAQRVARGNEHHPVLVVLETRRQSDRWNAGQ